MSEPISDSAAKPLTPEEFEARIEQRKREMEETPCYRCGHSPANQQRDCACCFWAHTPLPDGTFKEAA